MSHKRKNASVCVYCGLKPGTTDDHVLPRCLFAPMARRDMIKVPACLQCNNVKKSLDDDWLRDLLAADADAHPALSQFARDKFFSAVAQNKSALGRTLRETMRWEARYTSRGIYLGHYPTSTIDGERVTTLFSRIVQGLYYHALKRRLPAICTYEVARLDGLHGGEVVNSLLRAGGNGPHSLGGDGAGCVYMYGAEDASVTHWVLWFYNSIFITVSTEPAVPALTEVYESTVLLA